MNIKFNESFYLVAKDIQSTKLPAPKQLPTNFIFVIDVSGSMWGELDQIRKQLKNKLPSLVKAGDTVTIVWFSGRSDSGILKEEVEIKSLTSLQDLNTAIDRFLTPIGLTAFHKPLVLAKEAIGRIKKNRPNSVFSLIFLTDGYNNDCSWTDVTKSLKELEHDLAASTFVEYGYYADSKRISEMAELVGGEKVQAARFEDYDVVFEAKVQKTYGSSKKVTVELPGTRMFDFAFTIDNDGEIILYGVNNNQVLIPEATEKLMFFSTRATEKNPIDYANEMNDVDNVTTRLVYTSLYVLSDKLQTEYAEDVFKVLGDKNLYTVFTNAYGKEKLMSFKNLVKDCVIDTNKRFISGRVKNLVADENAYCVMNLIDDLTSDENALIYPGHEDFSYKRIGAKKVKKDNINEVKEAIKNASSVEEIQAIAEKMAIGEAEFVYGDKLQGYEINNLVWNSIRANLSIQVRFAGTVKLPKNEFGLTEIPSFVYRTYTIIKDGILNLNRLPVSISETTFNKLKTEGLVDGNYVEGEIVVIDFSNLPVVNKKMVKSLSAKTLAEKEYELFKLKCLEKVYKYYENELFPRVSEGFVEKYGKEAEEWLKSLGVTESNGYAPKMLTEKGQDFYMAPQLDTKISKHSTIPTVKAVIEKVEAGKKLNPVETIMAVAINEYMTTISSSLFTKQKKQEIKDEILKTWLSDSKMEVRKKRRQLLQDIAQIKFSLILSKKWFKEFSSFEENVLNLKIDGNDLEITFEFKEKEVNL